MFIRTKSTQVFVRQKNLTVAKAKNNPVKEAKARRLAPLEPHEVATVHEGLNRFGPRKWTEICTYLLPHRDASLLCKLFRQSGGDPSSARAPNSIRMALLAAEAVSAPRSSSP